MTTLLKEINPQQIELYERIQAFSLDHLEAHFPFSQRLARDNRWSLLYTRRVIEEYKKFLFLAVVAGHPVTPPDAVDQVWHLHLTYSRSYWQDFCPNVLQIPLHHEPTQGGHSERVKFNGWYNKTLESYRQFFRQVPPQDIWSEPIDRFGCDLNFARINMRQNWIVPKPNLKSLLSVKPNRVLVFPLLLLVAGSITGCERLINVPNPLNLIGSHFLLLYVLLSIVAIFLAFQIRSSLRLPNEKLIQRSENLDLYETAYLACGSSRVIETAIASLVQQGLVVTQPDQRKLMFNGSILQLSDPIERAVANSIIGDGHIDAVRRTDAVSIKAIHNQLQQCELLVSREQSAKAQFYSVLPIAALLMLGIAKICVGISRDKPVGFLCGLSLVMAFIGLVFWLVPVHRSRYGDRVLKNLRGHTQFSSVSPAESYLPLAFALFGMTVLSNETFAGLKTVLAPVSSDSGGGDSSGGDGGCGGCGGCGG